MAIGGLFFASSHDSLAALLVIANLTLAIAATLGTYLAFYILLPSISPLIPTISVAILGFFVVLLTITTNPSPFIDSSNSINWNLKRLTELSLYFLLLFSLASPFLIFAKKLFKSNKKSTKIISLIIVTTHFLGLINVSLLFSGLFKNTGLNMSTNAFDKILVSIGFLFVLGFLVIPLANGWFFMGENKTKSHKF